MMKLMPARRERAGTFIAALAVIGLPALVYEVAHQTSFGRVLLTFPWSRSNGIHLGDLVALLIALPFWLLALTHLLGSLRSWRQPAGYRAWARFTSGQHDARGPSIRED